MPYMNGFELQQQIDEEFKLFIVCESDSNFRIHISICSYGKLLDCKFPIRSYLQYDKAIATIIYTIEQKLAI